MYHPLCCLATTCGGLGGREGVEVDGVSMRVTDKMESKPWTRGSKVTNPTKLFGENLHRALPVLKISRLMSRDPGDSGEGEGGRREVRDFNGTSVLKLHVIVSVVSSAVRFTNRWMLLN